LGTGSGFRCRIERVVNIASSTDSSVMMSALARFRDVLLILNF
jgi:hypothetical protein